VERDTRDVWHEATFATVAERSRRIGAALLALGASATRPLMILSGNGIDHALMTFGALRMGIPVAPVPPGAALSARNDFARLRALIAIVRPGVVFARDGAVFAAAVRGAAPDAAFVAVSEPPAGVRAHDYELLLHHAKLSDDAMAAEGSAVVNGETVAKIVFTCDAAGEPKGVVTSHTMLCAMLQGFAQAWPFLDEHPPVIVDRLPWSGAFGGNVVLGIALRHAGTLYIEDGDSTTVERLERSARLRAEVQPTLAFDVPRDWAMWARRLRENDPLRRRWLERLDRACWTGATLAPAARDALRAIGVPLSAAWGATETSGAVTLTSGGGDPKSGDPRYDALGVPLAGVELKLVPSGDAYVAHVRGPQVMNGYYWRPDLNAAAFDEDGFFRTGDVVRPVHARAPARGLAYVRRTDERFKVSSGSWARGAELRAAFLTECSDAAEVLVSGQGRDEIGVLVWPTEAARRLERDVLRAQIADALRRVSRGTGKAEALRRALIVETQLTTREQAAALTRLHASLPDAEVIVTQRSDEA
jgi:feruloyl-CoA synthase